ncbi:hypothetical protein AFLA_008395 [Aspergillus flavus NRRL3357]|nr:uncharacterized protein G4B84_010203 [Aspergillus flavus NRRL3357]KAF7621843.1 hypothetical protein AFLA_008395 [Aspergillus flavus NRRL3357]QMW34737.1 hypothetical protein G4B84_010203 [Aspergillus flavus NRRL3357]
MLEKNLSSEIAAILKGCFEVYDHVGYNCQAAELLYAAGFINVEEGSSPISALPTPHGDDLFNYLDVCCWFQAKGASLYSQFPMKSALPIHHIAKCVGKWLGEDLHHRSGQVHKMQKDASSCQRALLKDVLADTEHHDSCVCACSVGGCLPSTILIAEATRNSDSRPDHILPRLFGFFGSIALDGVKEMHNILAPVVLRLCTFELLEITHTCGYHKRGIDTLGGRVTIYDVPEIHSEQRHLINRLEELVLEFEDRYRELNVTLPEFLTGYWKDRMDEVKAEEQVFDQEEAQRMREVGVIVEYPTSVSE